MELSFSFPWETALMAWLQARMGPGAVTVAALLSMLGEQVPVVACLRASPGIRRRWIPAAVGVLSLLVAASTVFVKQHAILDLAAGVVLGAFAVAVGFAVFRRRGETAG